MGGNQSVPKITKQDRAILECVHNSLRARCIPLTTASSLKLQRDKVKQYQKKVSIILSYCPS